MGLKPAVKKVKQDAPRKGDERYRFFGFQIVARPAKGPILWKRNGQTYTEPEVERIIESEVGKQNNIPN